MSALELSFSRIEADGSKLLGQSVTFAANAHEVVTKLQPPHVEAPEPFKIIAGMQGVTLTGDLLLEHGFELEALAKAITDAWVEHRGLKATGGRITRAAKPPEDTL